MDSFDNDGWPDLLLAGEWMPVTVLKNDHGFFKNMTAASGIANESGWWNSIGAGDFNNDGKMDYVVSNLGGNSFYKASDKYPVRVYAKDFDHNGIYDMIPSMYLPDTDGKKEEFPAQGWEDLIGQINPMRRKFPTYKSYATANMDMVLSAEDRKGALILTANNFHTSLLVNKGNGNFVMSPLPSQAQFSAINGMVTDDFDGDGNIDIIMNGNDYGTEVSVGRYDAMNGLLLKGDGKSNFLAASILQSGIFIPGDGKSLVALMGASGNYLVVAAQNRGPVKVFELKKNLRCVHVKPDDINALITYRNGHTRLQEFYYGTSFLSQSGRFLAIDTNVVKIKIKNNKGSDRELFF